MSLAKLRKRVDYWRGLREKGLEPSPVAEIPIEDAEALCDLADAARERRSVSTCEWCNDADCTGSGMICPCDYACHDAEYRADMALDVVLARLDGEDTG